MPHDRVGNDGDQGGKREAFNGPDVRPMPHDNAGNGNDVDVREQQGGGKRQAFNGPDARPDAAR